MTVTGRLFSCSLEFINCRCTRDFRTRTVFVIMTSEKYVQGLVMMLSKDVDQPCLL